MIEHGFVSVIALENKWSESFISSRIVKVCYAAWHVLLACVDRRAWAWMDEELQRNRSCGPLWRLKMLHFSLNRSKLEEAMEAWETRGGNNRMDRQLMAWEAPGQWLRLS